jgi:hypothetical protein
MARQLIQYVRLIDDLDGTEGDETTIDTVELGMDGIIYELDLTHAHAKALREFLAPYLEAAHSKAKLPKRALPKPSLPTRPPNSRDKDARAEIRDWARKNGYEVRDRGWIKAEAVLAYREAHPNAYIPATTIQHSEERTSA